MDDFINLYQQIEKCQDKIVNLETEYIGKSKGTLYQTRRAKYKKMINFYLQKCREVVTKHKVTKYSGTLGDKSFSIVTVDMDANSITFFLELTTGKKVNDLKAEEMITGNLEILE